jgi:hypothetical protein
VVWQALACNGDFSPRASVVSGRELKTLLQALQ